MNACLVAFGLHGSDEFDQATAFEEEASLYDSSFFVLEVESSE